MRPSDRAPKATTQERAHLRGTVATRGDIDHLNARAIGRPYVRAVTILENAKRTDCLILFLDHTFERSVVCPTTLKAQPTLKPSVFLARHLVKEFGDGGMAQCAVKLRKRQNRLDYELTLQRSSCFGVRHVEILTADPTIIERDPEQPQQRLHNRSLARPVDADKRGQALRHVDGRGLRSEAPEVR